MGALEAIERQVVIGDWYRRRGPTGVWRGAADAAALVDHAMRVGNIVLQGDPYYVAPEISALINANVEEMPDLPLAATDPPTPNGFAWIAEGPMGHYDAALNNLYATPVPIVAVAWSVGAVDVATLVFGAPQTREGAPAELLMGGDYPLGFTMGQWREWARQEVTPDAMGAIAGGEEAYRWMRCFWAFTKQRVVSLVHRDVPHSFKGSKWRKPAEVVRVVQLRARESSHEPLGTNPVEWSCRWIVRGHWHTVTCGPKNEPRKELRWYAPYVKGPEDKPLKKPQTTLFAVVR